MAHEADDGLDDRTRAMILHPHAAHAIAALSDDELRAVVDQHEDESADEFDPDGTDLHTPDDDGIEEMSHQ